MKKLYIHPATKKQLASIAKNPPQASLLTGVKGVGLATIARYVAEQITSKSNIITLAPDDKGSIKIAAVRELYSYARTKGQEKMVIIINEAETMQQPAQNALLKLLEEPPKHVIFILTAHIAQYILPTVLSRTAKVTVLPITLKQTNELMSEFSVKNETRRKQLIFMASGLPAETIRLSQDDEYFEERSASIRMARELIRGSTYQKLVGFYSLGNNRQKAITLLSDSAHILEVTIKKKPEKSLAILLDNVLKSQDKLISDGNVRAQLLKLALA